MAFVVLLHKHESECLIAIKKEWVENPTLKISKVFYSPNSLDEPNFNLPVNALQ